MICSLPPSQPCDWMSDAGLLTDPPTKIYTPPSGIPIDEAFPYQCAPGILGSSDESYQLSAVCQGRCPAGSYCPDYAIVEALECPAGSYCVEGSSSPLRARLLLSNSGLCSQP